MTQLSTQKNHPHEEPLLPASKPFTPESLGQRWSCSAEKVRQMIHRGDLAAFSIGKLLRITERTYARYSPSFMKDAAAALEF
jgi:hypothetical protein